MNYETLMSKLEEDHLILQPQAISHFIVHWRMLCLAFKYKQWSEFWGQIPRLILAIPGSLSGKAPRGNVGTTKMGIFEEK